MSTDDADLPYRLVSNESDDRFLLGFHAADPDVWKLLVNNLTAVEANSLKTAMTLASRDASRQGAIDFTSAKGREAFFVQTVLGGECTPTIFAECYLKSVTSVSFQKHRAELNFRLGKLYELHDADKPRKHCLRFRDFPALRAALEGPDFSSKKPPVTAYTERPMAISAVVFAPSAWEENGDAMHEEVDVIPSSLQVFALSECSNLQYHPHLQRYSFCLQEALMLATVEWKAQELAVTRVIHGKHKAPVVTSLHVLQSKMFFTAAADRTVCAWLPDEKYCFSSRARLPSAATCMAYDTVSQMLLAGATDGCVYLLPVVPKLASAVRKVVAHGDWCMSITPLPDLEQVATCGLDGIVKVWSSLFELRTTKTIAEREGTSGAKAPRHGSGLTHMSFSSSQKMLFAVEGGRNVSCWNVFLSTPSDVLHFHEKPIIGAISFKHSQEFITADASGKVAVWDMHRAVTTQRLGGPESEHPIGSISGMAYDPHRGSIAVMGSKLSLFVPEQGSFSPLFDLPVSRMHYAKLSRAVVVPTGNRIVVLDLLSTTTRTILTIGTEEIASSAMAAREHILIGTIDGTLLYSPITHWRPTTVGKMDDAVIGLYDLGANSKAGAQGEENSRLLAITRTGNVTHMAFGSHTGVYERAPPKHFKFLSSDLVQLTTFSKAHFILFGAVGDSFEGWDITYAYQKATDRLPCAITAITAVDEINGLFMALEDSSMRIYNLSSVIPVAVIASSLSPRALSDPIKQLVFNSNTCTMAVMTSSRMVCFSCERLVQGLQRNQHDAPFIPTNSYLLHPNAVTSSFDALNDNRRSVSSLRGSRTGSLATVKSLRGMLQRIKDEEATEEAYNDKHTLVVDQSTFGDSKPLNFPCRWKGCDRTIVVAEMESSVVSKCVARLVTLKRWWEEQRAAGIAAMLGEKSDTTDLDAVRRTSLFSRTSAQFDHSMSASSFSAQPSGRRNLTSTVETYVTCPIHLHVPSNESEQLLDGMVNQSVYSICEALPRKSAIGALEHATWNHRIALGAHTIDAIKWLAISLSSALHAIHSTGFVAAHSQPSIKYLCPNYKLCLDNGLFAQTPKDQPAAAADIDDLKRQVAEVHVPLEGISAVSPSLDMWLLGHALFRACSGRIFDASSGLNNKGSLDEVFDRHAQFIHPSVRHDVLLMSLLKGLLALHPKDRLTAIGVLQLASEHGEGIRRDVRTVEEAESVAIGAAVLDEITNNQKKKGSSSIVTFDQQLPTIVYYKKEKNEVGDMVGPQLIALMQFAPPAHLRVPSVPNPSQLGAAKRELTEVQYDDLSVRKVGIEDDTKRFRSSASNTFRSNTVMDAVTLMRNNSGFCKPSNESLASGPIQFYPVLKKGQFTVALFVESLQSFLVAEFDATVGGSGCSYIALRRNLAASSFAQTLAEYYRMQTMNVGGGKNDSLFRKYDAGPEAGSPYATLIVAMYPPNNDVQCLGGVESTDVEAAVTRRAGAGSVAAANKKDSKTVEGERRLVDKHNFGSPSNGSDSLSDDEEGGIRHESPRERAEILEMKTRKLAQSEASHTLNSNTHAEDEFLPKKVQYRPERLCPFFTESQATAEVLGIASTVPPPEPFYMMGWHRNRPLSRLKEGKLTDPTAYQARAPSTPSRLPPLTAHTAPSRKPFSVRTTRDELLFVTKGKRK